MQVESGPAAIERPEQIYARVFRTLKPRTRLPEIDIRYCRFANPNSFIRLQDGRLSLKISDLLEGAPGAVTEALAYILLCKLFRRPIPAIYNFRYRRFLNSKEMRRCLHLVRQIRGRKQFAAPGGETYDLEEIFEELNLRHFHGLMARPDLGWTRQPSRTTLGHYDPSHNAIVLNKILDRPTVRRLAVEYVMFHEMLHLRYPVKHEGARRCVHTPEFRSAESEFPSLAEAKALLADL